MIHDKCQTPTCFGNGMPSSENLLESRNTSPTLACWIRCRNMLEFDTCRDIYFIVMH
jgi:hypothetical protein